MLSAGTDFRCDRVRCDEFLAGRRPLCDDARPRRQHRRTRGRLMSRPASSRTADPCVRALVAAGSALAAAWRRRPRRRARRRAAPARARGTPPPSRARRRPPTSPPTRQGRALGQLDALPRLRRGHEEVPDARGVREADRASRRRTPRTSTTTTRYYGKIQGQLEERPGHRQRHRRPHRLDGRAAASAWATSRSSTRPACRTRRTSCPQLENVDFDPGRKHSLTWQSGFGGLAWNKEKVARRPARPSTTCGRPSSRAGSRCSPRCATRSA